jgi:type I restriction enzyme M protein
LANKKKRNDFAADSYEAKICAVNDLLTEGSNLSKTYGLAKTQLHLLTKTTIEQLTDPQVYHLLELKWINTLLTELYKMPEVLINELTTKVQGLADKYSTTYANVIAEIHETESTLTALLDELTGNDFDIQGLNEFQTLLK